MSRFFSEKYSSLVAYTPGEQPQNRDYIKLNTNESPFPPCESVAEAALKEARQLRLYSDPESMELKNALAAFYKVKPSQIITGNGSDELLNFTFMAFCDKNTSAYFPDITYGFYPVFANLNFIPYKEIPLKNDFSISISDYYATGGTVFIANPNAPTGVCLTVDDIEKIVSSNPENVVVIDEAYIDFGGESALKLIDSYDNLLIIRTYSKSMSLAGARLGFALGNEEIIKDLNIIKYSTNPYNVNRMSSAAGIAALEAHKYFENNCRVIAKNREYTSEKLRELGFSVLPSKANFIFAKSADIGGKELYLKLKENGILIRHFDKERICEYNRITIGTKEQMDALLATIILILEGK